MKHYRTAVSVALLSASAVATADHHYGGHTGYSAHYFGKVETIAGDVDTPQYKLVTNADKAVSGYAWVVMNDSTKQWVDADCRAQLEAEGLTAQVKPWEEISAYADSDFKTCDEIKSGVGGGAAMTRDTVEGYVFYDSNRNSMMDEGELGVTNVMVSNGYDVVKTDENGYYTLPAASRGLENFTVFVTKPAGWALPVDKDYVPQFHYHHMPNGSPALRFGGLPVTGPQPAKINFPLVQTYKKRKFKIAVSGDPQPYSNNEVGYVRDTLATELAARKDLEFVIIEGDVMGDDLDLYPRFKRIMSQAKIPQYFVAGNHDLDFDAATDENSFDTFKREWGPTYYSLDIGDVHFVTLDNVRYPCTTAVDNADGKHGFCDDPTSPTYNGVINEAQMEWLTNDLAHVADDKLIVLSLHIPLVSFVDMDATKHQTDNAQWLYDLIGDRPALALSGHTHTLENLLPGESYSGWQEALDLGPVPFPQIVTGAASGSWWGGDFDEHNIPMAIQRMGGPKGHLIIEFYGNQFKSRFKAALKSPYEQMSMDFLTPSFVEWFDKLAEWGTTPAESRPETPPVNYNDLPDTKILTTADLAAGSKLMVNVWNGSRDSKVWVKINDGIWTPAMRTQDGTGEGKNEALDVFALKKQMYVYRFAAKSESGNERAQGFEKFQGSKFGVSDPRPIDSWQWAQSSIHLWAYDLPNTLPIGAHTVYVRTEDVHGQRYKSHMTFEVMDVHPFPYWNNAKFEE